MAVSASEKALRDLFGLAGVGVEGQNPWDLKVHDVRFYAKVLQESSLGLGETYVDGWWDCEAIDQMIDRVLVARLDTMVKGNWRVFLPALLAKFVNMQSTAKVYEVGQKHYDLGNDLYQAMLDKRLVYTCGYWRNSNNLDDAQAAKLDLVCKKVGLKPGMSVLEYGCGWGSFAKFAAENYGVKVLGVTVSKEQVALGMELCKGLPVELRLQDYRTVEGKFDAVISIGIMEHVGYKNYRTYMKTADRCLKAGGVAFVHTIGANQSFTTGEPWSDKYIFPNGMLPSIAQLGKAMEDIFIMEDWHNFGPDYDKTLMAWVSNFEKAWPDLRSRYGERFYRMWRYYLLSSAGGFRSRNQQLWQIVMTRVGTPQPDCRII